MAYSFYLTICKFKLRVISIKFFKKWIKFLLSMGPNKKHIYISKPYERLHFLYLKKSSFHFVHKYISARQGELSSYCCSRNLRFNFTVRGESHIDFRMQYVIMTQTRWSPPSPPICFIPRISRAGILHPIFRFSGGVNIWSRIHQSKSWYSLGLCQTSKVDFFAEIVFGYKPLMLFVKGSILDVWLVL